MTRRERDRVPEAPTGVSRRNFLKGASLTIASAGIAGAAGGVAIGQESSSTVIVGPGRVQLEFTLNGKKTEVAAEPRETLLDLVRNRLDLTGAKRVCDRGSCGACTMIVDGKTVNSCSMHAIDARGKQITTVEGLASNGELTPIQKAFVKCDATQCGFCTPGMVVACSALLQRNAAPNRAQVAEALSGNICRCGTYQNIFEAVEQVVGNGRGRRARL